ncbi:serine/threonine-protein kinase [Nocardia sp. NPDC058058]|uniref:serine/threonine-protein kinase n=1 Tax=Nocardia sp. NPDC058058 TaxID=3346317 RepID=UPI0036DC788B
MGNTLDAGESFAGYRIERLLGAGGMGEVYLARDRDLPRFVALKILKGNGDAELARRFLREADAMARLDHPNIVTVHARGESAGRPWIAMAFVEGSDLAGVLTRGPIPLPAAVHILAEVAAALDYAHTRGIVHRDVKPANILLAETRSLITDFGIAKALDESIRLTSVSQVPASFQYVAPERLLLDATVDGRADVYSLGCTFFQMVTGTVPYRGTDLNQLIAAHLQAAIPAASSRNPLLPTALDAVLARALAKDPADRYPTCAQFARDAGRCLNPGADREPARRAAAPPTPTRVTRPRPVRVTRPSNPIPPQRIPAIHVPPLDSPRSPRPSRPAAIRSVLWQYRRRVIAGVVVAVAILGTTAAVRGWDDSSGIGTTPVAATIAVGQSPNAIAVDSAAHTAYVTNGAANTVSVIDIASRTVIATIPVGKYPNGVAVDSGAHTVYVTDARDNAVSIIDTVSHAVTASIPVGRNPTGVAVDPDIHTAYVTSGSIMGSPGDNTVSMIDTDARTVTATIPVGRNPNGVAVDVGAHTAYVANGDNTVSVINPEARAVSAGIPVRGGALAIAVDSGAHTAYVVGGVHENYVISVLDISSRVVTAAIPAGDLPIAVAVDPGARRAYVANNAALTVSVIDTAGRAITDTVRVGQGPQGLAVDPATHTVYVADLGDSTVSVLTR